MQGTALHEGRTCKSQGFIAGFNVRTVNLAQRDKKNGRDNLRYAAHVNLEQNKTKCYPPPKSSHQLCSCISYYLSMFTTIMKILLLGIAMLHLLRNSSSRALLIETPSDKYVGHPSRKSADMIEHPNIQHAQAPINEPRFAFSNPLISNETFDSWKQPHNCPYVASNWGMMLGEVYSHAGRFMSQNSVD